MGESPLPLPPQLVPDLPAPVEAQPGPVTVVDLSPQVPPESPQVVPPLPSDEQPPADAAGATHPSDDPGRPTTASADVEGGQLPVTGGGAGLLLGAGALLAAGGGLVAAARRKEDEDADEEPGTEPTTGEDV
jgi:LPXTG-motif cell wall-anchored protein